MRPLIGVTGRRFRLSLLQGADPRYGDRCIDTTMSDFSTRIADAGGLPVQVSYDTDPEAVCAWLAGVVIAGGQDVHPACWGGDTDVVRDIDPRTDPMVHDRDRDAYEIALVRAALDRGIPVLGVCRGLQVLNVALGGTLVADLAAGGRTNREIAQELFVTPKTVEVHLSAAYRKLGIASRHALAAALTA